MCIRDSQIETELSKKLNEILNSKKFQEYLTTQNLDNAKISTSEIGKGGINFVYKVTIGEKQYALRLNLSLIHI